MAALALVPLIVGSRTEFRSRKVRVGMPAMRGGSVPEVIKLFRLNAA